MQHRQPPLTWSALDRPRYHHVLTLANPGSDLADHEHEFPVELPVQNRACGSVTGRIFYHRAGDRVRTGDPQLGKLMLYQLSYSRLGHEI